MASPLDFINNNKREGFSVIDVIKEHKRSGTLGSTVRFAAPVATTTTPTPTEVPEVPRPNFFTRTADTLRATKNGEISFKEFIKATPGASRRVANTIAETLAPGLTKFVKTTGSIFGEGLAYAVDKNVREQYRAGNLDILPTITETTPARLAKYTFAAGLETAIFRSFPNVVQMKLAQRGGVGALQGLGMAITNGLAQDKTPEEIIKDIPTYGVGGAVLSVAFPYLVPLLKAEVTALPKELKTLLRGVDEVAKAKPERKITPTITFPDRVAVPISTPNTRYQAYLRSQGYEPYIPEKDLPVIDAGEVPKKRDELPTIQIGEPDTTVNLPPPPGTRLVPIEQPKILSTPARSAVTAGQEAQAPTRRASVPDDEPTPTLTTETFQGEPMIAPEPPTPRVTKVPAAQLPVGEGKTKVSRLEERMRKTLDQTNESKFEGENLATYQQMNKKQQIAKDAAYVEQNTDEAMRVLRGEKNIPEGNTYNGIALALSKQAELAEDAALATRLASLRSTRAGQEISLLTEADPDSVVSVLDEIITARRVGRARKGTTLRERGFRAPDRKMASEYVRKEVSEVVKKGKKELDLAKLKMAEAQKVLNDILC